MAVFTFIPDFPILCSPEWMTLESPMENGVKQYREKFESQIRTWQLTFQNRTLAETLSIEAFFNARHGKADSFTWVQPRTLESVTVRFAMDKFTWKEDAYEQCSFTMDLIEDIS